MKNVKKLLFLLLIISTGIMARERNCPYPINLIPEKHAEKRLELMSNPVIDLNEFLKTRSKNPSDKLQAQAILQELVKEGIVIVEFYAPGCTPCKQLFPILEATMKQTTRKAVLIRVDVDIFNHLTRPYKINRIPTLIFYKQGIEISRKNSVPGPELLQTIEQL